MKRRSLALAVLAAVSTTVRAIGPHEVLVLINGNSPRSIEIAREYARLRGIPETNLVTLAVPTPDGKTPIQVTPREFTEQIWGPATAALAERGIGDHILAWVYSLDFPVRVATEPRISIQGLTFLRNRLPDPQAVRRGEYVSLLFAGPDGAGGPPYSSQTLDSQSLWLGRDMPLPSVALGYMGERGNTREAVLKCLADGARADGSAPTGTVYYVASDDVRSRCRAWQFESARRELLRAGLAATILTNPPPTGMPDVLGLMIGAPYVKPAADDRYLPGSLADNLTSFGAAFDDPDQTKLSAWIAGGATAAAGTVTEPSALWAKFPNARLFAHYRAGCTVIESYYQSIKCPLQIWIAGDPLTRPWMPRDSVSISGLGTEPVSAPVTLRAEIHADTPYVQYAWLVDGRMAREGLGAEAFTLEPGRLAEGAHTVRVVARTIGMVKNQVFEERTFTVTKRAEAPPLK
jgi:hypothetical protein